MALPPLSPAVQAALAAAQAAAAQRPPAHQTIRKMGATATPPPKRKKAKPRYNPLVPIKHGPGTGVFTKPRQKLPQERLAHPTTHGTWQVEAAVLIEHQICCKGCGEKHIAPNKHLLYRLTRQGVYGERDVWEVAASAAKFAIPARLPQTIRRLNGQISDRCPACFQGPADDPYTPDMLNPHPSTVEVEIVPDAFDGALEAAQAERSAAATAKVKSTLMQMTLEDL